MQLSDLLDNNDNREIDGKKTRLKVTNFMENQYQQLKYLANTSPLQSVSYDNVKVQTSPSNSIESKAIKQLQAKEYVRIIDDCINSMDEIKRKIFKYKLIDNKLTWQIEGLTRYGKTAIYNIYKKSCVEFAKQLRLVTDLIYRIVANRNKTKKPRYKHRSSMTKDNINRFIKIIKFGVVLILE